MTTANKVILSLALISPFGLAHANTMTDTQQHPRGPNTGIIDSTRQGDVSSQTRRANTFRLNSTTITEAQEALSERGYDVRADGVAGIQTSRAVRKFQADNGIPQTGRLDEPTLNALSVSVDDMSEDFDRLPASTPTGY